MDRCYCVLLLLFCFISCAYQASIQSGKVIIDGSKLGRALDGIGGLSGGGATSRLLIDYQEPYRSQILDFLFLPGFGASLQILKVEIGGDGFTSCGSEPSHMHSEDDENYFRGYEWWLMKEAKKRNPKITLYGLPWAFPGWIGDGNDGQPLNLNQAIYQTKWVLGAKKYHNLTIDYLGIWNEKSWTADFVKILRKQLDDKDLQHVQIVLGDLCCGGSDWTTMADALLADPAFLAATGVMGEHYPVASMSDPIASTVGIPLWSSEDSSTFFDDVGTGCWARILNWNYIMGNMTATIMWNLITSYYPELYWWGDSLTDASNPWSGNYEVKPPIWVTAHTTQFTEPGWKYLSNGTGSGFLPNGGSYVTLVSPSGTDFSMIIETMQTQNSQCIRCNPSWNWTVSPQTVEFELSGGLQTHPVLYVWKSRIFGQQFYFEQQSNIQVKNGLFSLFVEPDAVVTITTTTGQHKGSYPTPPAPEKFPFPYHETFDGYPVSTMPLYFSDMTGSFAIYKGPKGSEVYRQEVRQYPITWVARDSPYPITIVGDFNMTDYKVSVDANIIENDVNGTTGVVMVGARVVQGPVDVYTWSWFEHGYFLYVDSLGNWWATASNVTLGAGKVQMSLNSWHKLTLQVKGQMISGYFDKTFLFKTIDSSFANGFAALSSGWHFCEYDEFFLEKAE